MASRVKKKKNQAALSPMPEMLGRKDRVSSGSWRIDECEPVRGKPMTSIMTQHMVVPVGDEVVDRVIRAHEMTHARISPAEDFGKWIERGFASQQAMVSLEEVRVNFVAKKAGFDTSVLRDGSETASGVMLAERGDWKSLVYTAVGYSYSGGGKDFLTGVRRVNRAWGMTLKEITKRVEKEMEKAWRQGDLASTQVDPSTGLSPRGFAHVERLGEWLDRLAELTDPTEHDDDDDATSGTSSDSDSDTDGDEDSTSSDKTGKVTKPGASKETQDGTHARPKVDEINPHKSDKYVIPTWMELKIASLPLTRTARGGIGNRRVPSNIGRNPRRITNALTDPQRRVFDANIRGKGGVVLVDGSGSMSITTEQILRITEQAPGCVVAVYSGDRDNSKDNLWIIAKNGKMVSDLPDRNGGNGVDGPAIKWAIKQRKNNRTPIVWVTDGGVHGASHHGGWDSYHDVLALDCLKDVLKNGVFMAAHVEDGIQVLTALRQGKRPKRWIPERWLRSYERVNGVRVVA